MMRVGASLFIALALCGAAFAQTVGAPKAQDLPPATKYVAGAMSDIEGFLAANGYTKTQVVGPSTIKQGAKETVSVPLRVGVTYTIMGVCDKSCGNMDLAAYDAAGNTVASEYAQDNAPLITVKPEATETHEVRIDMVACAANPCAYGVVVYGKPN